MIWVLFWSGLAAAVVINIGLTIWHLRMITGWGRLNATLFGLCVSGFMLRYMHGRALDWLITAEVQTSAVRSSRFVAERERSETLGSNKE